MRAPWLIAGTRLSPANTDQAKVAKLCITLGQVVPTCDDRRQLVAVAHRVAPAAPSWR
jgi:hypothetical protein